MVGLSDTPIFHRKSRRAHWMWVALIAAVVLVSFVSWGKSALIPVGNAQGLDIQVDFRGYDNVAKGGMFAYAQGKTLRYQVIVTNKSNLTLSGIELQSMIQGIKTRLPGDVISPAHKTSLAPGQVYRFDVEYATPQLASAAHANLVVNARYQLRGAYKSDSFLCPTPVRFE